MMKYDHMKWNYEKENNVNKQTKDQQLLNISLPIVL